MSSEQTINVKEGVMNAISEHQLAPRPNWYYVLGSALWFVGLLTLFINISFLVHRFMFLRYSSGPVLSGLSKAWQAVFLLLTVPIGAMSFYVGTRMCRRYGLLYRQHPHVLAAGMVAVIIAVALLIEFTPLREAMI